jgi:hypothetical protein
VLPVEDEAGIDGELLEERALGPAVPPAERVDGVDLTEVTGCRPSPGLPEGYQFDLRLSNYSRLGVN